VYPSREEGVGDLGRLYAQAETFPRKDVPIWYNGGFTVFMYHLANTHFAVMITFIACLCSLSLFVWISLLDSM